MRLKPGDTFDRYSIEESLGEGGMGEVYRALDTRLHRRVALKVLRRAPDADPTTWDEAAARMMREAQAAAALNHPNAVSLYDVGEHEGTPFLAMELVDGPPLRRYVGTQVPQSTRIRWLLDVACALAAAHRVGVVHRDVKPENVMLRSDGVIKVLDFGIARRVRTSLEAPMGDGSDATAATITSPGKLIGTPAYMAPEQIRAEEADGRADQFSWGVMAYELLSGRLPFGHGRDVLAVIAAVLGDQPAPLEGVPESIAAVVARAMSKRREDRFASMDDVVELLEPFITGEMNAPSSRRLSAVMIRPEPPLLELNLRRDLATINAPTTTPTQSRRRPRWQLAGFAGVALGVATALGLGWAVSTNLEPPEMAPSTSSSSSDVVTPITSLPAPQTTSPQALTAYREGLQAFRDAQWYVAQQAFLRAVELDPFFAAAHLRLAQTHQNLRTQDPGRAHFQRAISLRAALGPRDQALMEVYEPLLLRDPADVDEGVRRLQQASRRYPDDMEFLSLQALHVRRNDPAASLALASRCVERDPAYADCWQAKGKALEALGRAGEAYDAIEECVRVSPAATDCLRDRARMHARAGRCSDYEQDLRTSLAQHAGIESRYLSLAEATYAIGRPPAAVHAVLEQLRAHATGQATEVQHTLYEANLMVLGGDLRGARSLVRELHQKHHQGAQEATLLSGTRLLEIALSLQLGDAHQAARDAAEHRGVLEARLGSSSQVTRDPTMTLLHAELEGELLTRSQYVARREAWLRAWELKLPPQQRGQAWLRGYAFPASTQAEAEEALAALPRFQPLPLYREPDQEEALGRVNQLAGRSAEARASLVEFTRACVALRFPVTHTVAHHHLGLSLEAQGDTTGACAAYRVVLSRWPVASGAVTSKATAARVKALGCPN
ncbi:serine/threonine-protein kinase [Chondromyces crocatus]|uniref:Protein kinase domain-containing protein n=1 Tax=Chondromyces crocatus TaxID=52 RepID=A0A0K1EF73_CHOCO|nr:serine/threonine-protein kinase [Chondromyces crocatus]AKT39516.1 uncharacterized protein CMC5_036630 [Chondromyces crocatus]